MSITATTFIRPTTGIITSGHAAGNTLSVQTTYQVQQGQSIPAGNYTVRVRYFVGGQQSGTSSSSFSLSSGLSAGQTFSPSYSSRINNTAGGPAVTDGTQLTYTAEVSGPGGQFYGPFDSNQTLTWRQAPTADPSSPEGDVVGLSPTLMGSHSTSPRQTDDVRVEVRRASDNALHWASGWIATSGSTFSVPYAGSALAHNVQFRWRVQARDSLGVEGDWSSWLTFRPLENTPPTASLISPSAGATVGTLTPTLTLAFSDPDSHPTLGRFDAYQAQVRRVSDQVSFLDTGQTSTNSSQQSSLQVALVYAGTTLVNGTPYEWRARVWDGAGAASAFTAWRTFTPAAAPNPPTIVSPLGLIETLTPGLSGTYNQGQGSGEGAFQYQIRQGITTIFSSGDVGTAIATGVTYGGSPALLWGTNYSVRMRSKDAVGTYSDWTSWQSFRTNAAPTTPTNLSPSGGAITSNTTPTLAWQHNDPDGDAQEFAQVEIQDLPGETHVTGYDPKTLEQSTQTHAVTETLPDSPTEYRWRVRTRGTVGPGYGPYSDWRTFIVADAPDITIDTPDAQEELIDPTVLVEWTFSGGSGTQQDYRVVVYAADQSNVLYDTGVVAGDDDEHTIASGALPNLSTLYVQIIARDTLDQGGASSLLPFTTNWTGPGEVTGVSAVPIQATGALPGAYLSWDAVATPFSEFLAYRVYRRPEDVSAWELVHTSTDRMDTAWADYTMASDVTYSYHVVQLADVGGADIESGPSSIAQASVTVPDLFLHDVRDPVHFAWLRIPGQRQTLSPDVTYLQPWGQESPTAYVGDAIGLDYGMSLRAQWHGDDADGFGPGAWRAVEALLRRQRDAGAVLLARQRRDVLFYCVIESAGRDDQPGLYTIDVRLRRVTGPRGG